jgi:hypothetical protein
MFGFFSEEVCAVTQECVCKDEAEDKKRLEDEFGGTTRVLEEALGFEDIYYWNKDEDDGEEDKLLIIWSRILVTTSTVEREFFDEIIVTSQID